MRTFLSGGPAVCRHLFAAVALALAVPPALASDDPAVLAETTPSRVLSIVSGGYWEAEADAEAEENAGDDSASREEGSAGNQARRGYYRSVAIRSADNTSRLFLQRIWLSPDGPMLLDSREINALTDLQAYITDMRPENSTGIAKQHGFVTFVYLKRDPQAQEPDTWELYVDEFGDTAFTPASN